MQSDVAPFASLSNSDISGALFAVCVMGTSFSDGIETDQRVAVIGKLASVARLFAAVTHGGAQADAAHHVGSFPAA